MTNNRNTFPMRTAKTGYIVLSVAFCILGAALMIFPDISVSVFERILGISLIVFGVVKLIGYFSKDLFRLAFQYDLALGILLMALGIIALEKQEMTINLLFIMMGIPLLADGLFKIQIALDAKRFGIGSWWLILTMAIVTGVFGVLLVLSPDKGARFLFILLGLSLFSEGLMNLCVAISTVKIIRHQKPEVFDVEYTVVDDGK